MATSSQKILAELVDHISHKQNLYRSAYSADLKRLESTHGSAAIAEALQLVERKRDAGHGDEVRQAVDRLLQRRRRITDFDSFAGVSQRFRAGATCPGDYRAVCVMCEPPCGRGYANSAARNFARADTISTSACRRSLP